VTSLQEFVEPQVNFDSKCSGLAYTGCCTQNLPACTAKSREQSGYKWNIP